MTKKHSQVVKQRFEDEYLEYDQNVRDVLPDYEEMSGQVVEEVNLDQQQKLEILDLGIGTGQTAIRLLEKFPNSHLTGVDLSPKMLAMAKNRLADFLDRVEFIEQDIIDLNPAKRYDACTAVLSVHHLNKKQKQELFTKIHKSLNDRGVFVIGDMIIGDSKEETAEIEKAWQKQIADKLGDKAAEFWMKGYREEDIPDSINDQLKWLKKAGFDETGCNWHKLNCAAFYGRK